MPTSKPAFIAAYAFLLLPLCAFGVATPPLMKDLNASPVIVPLEPYADEHWAFRAKIKGKEELFVIDTGGGLTVITPEAAKEFGCEPWGQLTGFRMRGDRLDVQRCDNVAFDMNGVLINLATTGIWDFKSLLPKDAAPIAGSVGFDAFVGRVVTLDIAHRQLILETPKSLKSRIRGETAVPVQFIKEAEGYSTTFAVALDTPKGRIWMHLDSGDDVPITIGRHIAAETGLDPQRKGPQAFDRSLVGGVPLRGSAYVKDLIFDGNIGAPILSTWVVTVDLLRQRLWISPQ